MLVTAVLYGSELRVVSCVLRYYWLGGVALHSSIHKVEFFYVHGILAQLCKVTPIDLDAANCGVISSIALEHEVWVLAGRSALHL